jgi:hypothetical protein
MVGVEVAGLAEVGFEEGALVEVEEEVEELTAAAWLPEDGVVAVDEGV